jgi:hypothetical protein
MASYAGRLQRDVPSALLKIADEEFAARINEQMALAKIIEDAAADRVDLILNWCVGLAILVAKSGIIEKMMIAGMKNFQPREILHFFLV